MGHSIRLLFERHSISSRRIARGMVACVAAVVLCVSAAAGEPEAGQPAARISRLPTATDRGTSVARATHPIDAALEIAQASLRYLEQDVEDYTAMFVKRCRVNDSMPPLQFAKLKLRNRKWDGDQLVTPMGVYLDFLKPNSVKGREVIWVEGENDGNMIVHQGGYASFITAQIDPDGMLAMRGQRYSIREIGIENLLRKFIQVGLNDRLHDECDVRIDPEKSFGGKLCTLVEVHHPVRRDHFRFHRARVYFDNQTGLPIRYQAWMWPETRDGDPILDEEYNYFNLTLNVGLSPADFDPDNPEYRFR